MVATLRALREKEGRFPSDNALPLVIESDASAGVDALTAWIEANHAMLDDQLRGHGALLFRGFPVRGAEDFERIALAVDARLRDRIPLDDGRRRYKSRFVYEGASYDPRTAAFVHLPFHFEDYYLPASPTKIMFCCAQAATSGGETVIVDGRRVLRSLPAELRGALENERYTNGRQLDLGILQENAGTTDRAEIERIFDQYGVGKATWGAAGARPVVTLSSDLPVVERHEVTGEPVWFNALMQKDLVGQLCDGLWSLSRVSDARLRVTAALGILAPYLFSPRKYLRALSQRRSRRSRNLVSPSAAYQIARAFWQNAVAFTWRTGDVLVLDNHLVAHGRMPHLGSRELLACTTKPAGWSEAPSALASDAEDALAAE